MFWPDDRIIAAIETENTRNILSFGNCDDRGIDEVQSALCILLQNLMHALQIGVGNRFK